MVLLSGGIDSSACIQYYQENGFEVEGLFVDFGQLAVSRERKAVTRITKHYNIKSSVLTNKGFPPFRDGEIQGRNLFLVSSALMFLKSRHAIIALGIHAGTNYIDCSELFVQKLNVILDMYSSGKTTLGAPFLSFTKAEIFEYSKIKGLPVELTYSCELGLQQPCGKCSSCKDLRTLYASTNKYSKTSKRY